MEEINFKVYAFLDEHNAIIGVESTGFYSEEDLIEQGYIFIDEGTSWSTYYHAQPNYLSNKYGKSKLDDKMFPNFKYVDGSIVELTEEEKAEFYPPIAPQPTFEEMQNDINIDVDYRLSMLELGI